MTWKRLTLWIIVAVLALNAAVLIAGWLLFVPAAKEQAYVFVTAWGEEGTRPGQFNDPTGIAIAGGEVFVADSRNGRIQVFDLDGTFKRQFGAPGSAPGELGRPMNLAVHEDELYVPEYFNDRIQVFSLAGVSKRFIGTNGGGPGEFSAPGGVAVDDNGHLYVADFFNHRVQELRPDGSFVRQWGKTGKTGHGIGEFYYPTDVALDEDGTLYMADGYGHRIQVFRKDTFIAKWGGPMARGIYGPFNGWFRTVTAITVSPAGNVFAADFYNDRVQKFSARGDFLTEFGDKGEVRLHHPLGIAFAPDGSVFVTDFLNNRVTKWAPAE